MVAAMARSGDQASEIWGTWEELLLACAVNRHGTRSWDSVAMEVQSRSPAGAQLLTPQSCRQRYRDLQRRFGVDGACDDPAPEVPWLEELRKLRVAELRREVERYDVSIGSLQLKVKRLKEERERSLRETTAGEGVPDPKDEEMRDAGSPGSTPETCGGERISAGDSGRSWKESNSTDPKEDEGKASGEDGKLEEASAPDGGELDPVVVRDEKPAGEGSYNGSSDTIAKGAVAPASSAAADVDAAQPQLGESGESVAESKEGEGEKESSDVHSSASLSKRRRRGRQRKVVSGSSSTGGGEGREAGEVSKRFAAESQPLVAFLEIIRSQDYGSVFESRLESQECVRYRSLIRRHVDLEMVRSKIERGAYTSVEFFRDLLLLCTNAVVFYNKGSPESSAAIRLRELVAKEMSLTIRKSPPPTPPPVEAKDPPPQLLPEPPLLAPKLKLDPDIKPENKRSAPLIACKKRSSISAKPSAPLPAIVAGAKEERDEKRDVDRKEQEGEGEDQGLALKKAGERSGTRGLRSNKSRGRSRGGAILKSPIPVPTPTPAPAQSVSPPVPAEAPAKSEKKSGGAAAALSMAKKRDAATFLNRISGKSRTSNGALLGTLKGQSSGTGSVQKKASGVKGDGRKEQVSRSKPGPSSASKRSSEHGAPVKRSVGRPPKRAAPPPVPPPAKRAREEVDHAAPSKKKGRK